MPATVQGQPLAPLVQRVMQLSLASAALIVIDGIISLIITANVWFVFIGLCVLAIPLCGYCGAKNKNKDYMCCFCGWSFLFFTLTFMNLIWAMVYIVRGINPYKGPSWQTAIIMVISAISAVLYFFSYYYGNRLHSNHYFEPPPLYSMPGHRGGSSVQMREFHPQPRQLPPPMLMGTVSAPMPPPVYTAEAAPVEGQVVGQPHVGAVQPGQPLGPAPPVKQ